ncbi:MAG: dTDP-4-dehydrorhamnose 3,5-epimerase family protein, partial [Flavobacteriales bacterium]
MQIIEKALNGLKLLKPNIFEDNRGYFFESYNLDTFEKLGITDNFIQDN